LKRGAVANYSWSLLVKSALEPLLGDGLVPYGTVEEDSGQDTWVHEALDHHDNLQAQILFSALQNYTGNPYDFVLGYFGDVDARSHQHGPLSER
jgi:predicted AlkP superfamily pyrophosphatase or phosphodiesterase